MSTKDQALSTKLHGEVDADWLGASQRSICSVRARILRNVTHVSHWPLRPTTAAATHYPAVAAAIVRIIAESATALARHKAGELVSNDLKAFALSVGGLLAVAGSGLLVLWAVLS